MKGSILAIFCMVAYSSAAVLGANLLDKLPPLQKAVAVEHIKPQINPAAKRIRLTYGPYKIKAQNVLGLGANLVPMRVSRLTSYKDTSKVGNGVSGDPYGTAYNYFADKDFPTDITVLYTTAMPTLDKTTKITLKNGLYVHHTLWADTNHKSVDFMSCETAKPKPVTVSVFMAGGLETADFKFTNTAGLFKSGYYIGKDSKIMINIDIVNYDKVAKDLYMVAEMEYLPGKSVDILPAQHSVIDLGFCDAQNGLDVHAPSGQTKFSLKGSTIVVAKDGWLFNANGHLHDGGTGIQVMLNEKNVCESTAKYGGPGFEGKNADGKTWYTINQMTVCSQPIKLSKGDKMYFQANYDMDKYPSRQSAHGEMAEGMALVTGIFVPAGQQ